MGKRHQALAEDASRKHELSRELEMELEQLAGHFCNSSAYITQLLPKIMNEYREEFRLAAEKVGKECMGGPSATEKWIGTDITEQAGDVKEHARGGLHRKEYDGLCIAIICRDQTWMDVLKDERVRLVEAIWVLRFNLEKLKSRITAVISEIDDSKDHNYGHHRKELDAVTASLASLAVEHGEILATLWAMGAIPRDVTHRVRQQQEYLASSG